MSRQTKSAKGSRHIPEHIKRAVNARDQQRCRNCGVTTEFIHYDHIYPFDLGGPTTIENMQSLCPKCNTSKGNKITCRHCGHWMSPDNAKCPQCETRLPYSKRSQTLAGKLELLFEKVGRVVVIGAAALVVLLLLSGGLYVSRFFHSARATASDDAASVQTIVNDSFTVSPGQPTGFKVVVPGSAKNARIVGGFKVTGGGNVNCYVANLVEYEHASQGGNVSSPITAREQIGAARLRQPLTPGTYYLMFTSPDAQQRTVAAEFYLKFD